MSCCGEHDKADDVVAFLNEVLSKDQEGIEALLTMAVPTTEEFKKSGLVVVAETQDNQILVTSLAIISGIVQKISGKQISVKLDEKKEKIESFVLV